jgi:hypothetical protein
MALSMHRQLEMNEFLLEVLNSNFLIKILNPLTVSRMWVCMYKSRVKQLIGKAFDKLVVDLIIINKSDFLRAWK